MTTPTLVFPERNLADVTNSLRKLADDFEQGKYGDSPGILWVIDSGQEEVTIGLLGKAPEPAVVAYYLLGLGMREREAP